MARWLKRRQSLEKAMEKGITERQFLKWIDSGDLPAKKLKNYIVADDEVAERLSDKLVSEAPDVSNNAKTKEVKMTRWRKNKNGYRLGTGVGFSILKNKGKDGIYRYQIEFYDTNGARPRRGLDNIAGREVRDDKDAYLVANEFFMKRRAE